MMKTLCVAVVVLSLSSVCQPAPLTCEKLLKPVDKAPDLSGRWYSVALYTEFCATLGFAVFQPSVKLDIIYEDTGNFYEVNLMAHVYGHCLNKSQQFLYENNTLFDISSKNTASVLLHSGCPDCIVMKTYEDNSLMLLSRRQNVTAAELKEFETQGECVSPSHLQILNTDHDYENCKPLAGMSDADAEEILSKTLNRVRSVLQDIRICHGNPIHNFLSTLCNREVNLQHLLV